MSLTVRHFPPKHLSFCFFKYTIENFGIKKFLMQAVERGLQTSP